jgi:hypothetical protein
LSNDNDLASDGGLAVDGTGLVTPGDYEIEPANGTTLATAGVFICDELARGDTVTNDLVFVTPTDVTVDGATIVVTFLAVVN